MCTAYQGETYTGSLSVLNCQYSLLANDQALLFDKDRRKRREDKKGEHPPGRLIGEAQLLSKAPAAGPYAGMHDVPLRPAAVLQQVAGGQDAQQAAGLGEGNAAHAQQLSGCSPLEGAREEGE